MPGASWGRKKKSVAVLWHRGSTAVDQVNVYVNCGGNHWTFTFHPCKWISRLETVVIYEIAYNLTNYVDGNWKVGNLKQSLVHMGCWYRETHNVSVSWHFETSICNKVTGN